MVTMICVLSRQHNITSTAMLNFSHSALFGVRLFIKASVTERDPVSDRQGEKKQGTNTNCLCCRITQRQETHRVRAKRKEGCFLFPFFRN